MKTRTICLKNEIQNQKGSLLRHKRIMSIPQDHVHPHKGSCPRLRIMSSVTDSLSWCQQQPRGSFGAPIVSLMAAPPALAVNQPIFIRLYSNYLCFKTLSQKGIEIHENRNKKKLCFEELNMFTLFKNKLS